MCTRFSVCIQENRGGEWVNTKTFELPDESMPLCGCWLFPPEDYESDYWKQTKDAHESTGRGDEFERTKRNSKKLNDMFRDKLFEALKEMSYSGRIIIEQL